MTQQTRSINRVRTATLAVLSLLTIPSCKKEGSVAASNGPPESTILEACKKDAGNHWGGGNVSDIVRGSPLPADKGKKAPVETFIYPVRVVYQKLQEQPFTWDPVTKLPRPGDWKAAPLKVEFRFVKDEFNEWHSERIRSGWLSDAPGPLINDYSQRSVFYEAYKKADIDQLEALLTESKAVDQKNGVPTSHETKLRQFWLESARNIQDTGDDLTRDQIEQRQIDQEMGVQPNEQTQRVLSPESSPHQSEDSPETAAGVPEEIEPIEGAKKTADQMAKKQVARMQTEREATPEQGSEGKTQKVPVVELPNDADGRDSLRAKAASGDSDAQYKLGRCYYLGEGALENHAEGIAWFRKAAEQGNAQAQFALGYSYGRGEGVNKDLIEAAKWMRRSAEQGDPNAQRVLGQSYLDGIGVPKDETEAVKWLTKASHQGDAEAQINLGICYAEGDGVPDDDVEAVKWFRKAAEQGHATAQCIIGCCYHDGNGVPADNVVAYAWLNLSAASGHVEAKQRREQITSEMTKDEIAAGQKLSREWEPKQVVDGGAETKQAAVTEKTSSPSTEPRVEPTTKSFLTRFIESGESETPNEVAACYAELVDYYDQGQRSRDQIRQDVTEHFGKWPKRSYRLVGEPQVVKESGTKEVITCDVAFEVSDGTKRIEGVAQNSITLDVEKMKIVRIREKVVKRRTTVIGK